MGAWPTTVERTPIIQRCYGWRGGKTCYRASCTMKTLTTYAIPTAMRTIFTSSMCYNLSCFSSLGPATPYAHQVSLYRLGRPPGAGVRSSRVDFLYNVGTGHAPFRWGVRTDQRYHTRGYFRGRNGQPRVASRLTFHHGPTHRLRPPALFGPCRSSAG
jgi:hypothetical protein